MARRRVFSNPEAENPKNLYEALIAIGICITFAGIFSTSYLAILEGTRAPFQAWITGGTFF